MALVEIRRVCYFPHMLTAEITQHVSKLGYGDRSELVGLLIDSLDDDSIDDDGEDSLTTAIRRSAEMKSGEEPGITVEELWASVQAGRKRG